MNADTVIREDCAWTAAARAFSEAKAPDDSADAVPAQALLSKETGAVVLVTRHGSRERCVRPSACVAGLNLNAYRGKSREELRNSVTR
jgi:hypothetical protein